MGISLRAPSIRWVRRAFLEGLSPELFLSYERCPRSAVFRCMEGKKVTFLAVAVLTMCQCWTLIHPGCSGNRAIARTAIFAARTRNTWIVSPVAGLCAQYVLLIPGILILCQQGYAMLCARD